jgi:hypothetical protein
MPMGRSDERIEARPILLIDAETNAVGEMVESAAAAIGVLLASGDADGILLFGLGRNYELLLASIRAIGVRTTATDAAVSGLRGPGHYAWRLREPSFGQAVHS